MSFLAIRKRYAAKHMFHFHHRPKATWLHMFWPKCYEKRLHSTNKTFFGCNSLNYFIVSLINEIDSGNICSVSLLIASVKRQIRNRIGTHSHLLRKRQRIPIVKFINARDKRTRRKYIRSILLWLSLIECAFSVSHALMNAYWTLHVNILIFCW